ncbi:MAG: hypothetical protein EOO38_24650, partial [Cytophagaceae bacterium]
MSKGFSAPRIIRITSVFFVSMWVTFCFIQGYWATLGWSALFLSLGILVFISLRVTKIKQSWMETLSSSTWRAIRLGELPQLDRNELERLTREWEALGFVQRGDFLSECTKPKYGAQFSRLFENESEGAVVELAQGLLPKRTVSFTSVIESFWGEEEREQLLRQVKDSSQVTSPLPSVFLPHAQNLTLWLLATSSAAPGAYESLFRQPRLLVARLEASTPPVHLWHAHQKRCVLLSRRLGAQVLRGELVPLMWAHSRMTNLLMLQRLKAIPIWTLLRCNFVRLFLYYRT